MDRQLFQKVSVHQDAGNALIDSLVETQRPITIGFLNHHGANLCHDNDDIKNNFNELDVLLRDGIGIKIAMSHLKMEPGDNLNGTDFIPTLLKKCKTKPLNVIAFGTQEPWLSKGLNALGLDPYISCVENGFHQSSYYLEKYKNSLQPKSLNVVLLAMGMPKQEHLAAQLKTLSNAPVLIICGGAILDFQAGRFQRAPNIIRQFGLEWAYRLIKEPKRLFRRYVIGIPLFFKRMIFISE
ncbi:WecB/TagA/CpsF family glycosyltransferase [Vibrio sp. SM6]|uniref:WecB/TagA/CpsF family glycosyltransferase n=1 Tax=Vibrio agarilyticus TaxID=2726741 RepID=A0A7X8TPG8_9VIBR|nr:WecB/TagA/CpsF family glycosyltransferase [Vibrio agarilyticus]NLS12483.1 WecB/TagA/CpsF family glycosyltransferase [Vibrio agarilyticus]